MRQLRPVFASMAILGSSLAYAQQNPTDHEAHHPGGAVQ
jgi:hypothetical protein